MNNWHQLCAADGGYLGAWVRKAQSEGRDVLDLRDWESRYWDGLEKMNANLNAKFQRR